MMKHRLVASILLIFAASLLIIGSLYFVSPKPNTDRNHFFRHFFSPQPIAEREIGSDRVLLRISGVYNNNLYVVTNKANELMVADLHLISSAYLSIPLPENHDPVFYSFIDASEVTILTRSLKYRFDINTKQLLSDTFPVSFSKAIALSAHSFIIKKLNRVTGYPELSGYPSGHKKDFKLALATMESNTTNYFSFDGMIVYNKPGGRVCYVYFYMNKFLCLDTNLHLLYQGSTIDTCKTPLTRSRGINSSPSATSLSLASPPRFVNSISCLDSAHLFICSKIKADNESMDTFKSNCVIDIYNVKDGSYAGSFYIPRKQGKMLKALYMQDHILYVMYEHYLSAFNMGSVW